jgi:molybdopterin-guanine dinucleotide biosynthesis protein A
MTGRKRLAVSGIVLAGGGSTRFGADKLRADVDGQPLLHLPIEALAEICLEIVVVVSTDDEPPLPVGLGSALRVARDEEPGGGPLIGLIAGLAEAREPIALVVGGDMPRLVPDLLAELIHRASQPSVEAAALEEAGWVRPLPAAVRRRRALDSARALRGDGRSSLHELLDSLRLDTVSEADWRPLDPTGQSLLDVDRPEDLDALVAGLSTAKH